ncbi:MAG: LAGLIDADG family homing endonuclease, partial [Terrimicrobiaceae bacterium]
MKEIVISEGGFKVLSVEDSMKKYTPDLSDNDIKGFVWYNRTLGIPMTGFEKYFIPNTNKNVATAKNNVDYLNQQYEVIGKFQAGDEVGKVTRFENYYSGKTYVAIRRFDNSLCLVDKGELNINDKYEVSTKELEALVKSKSLMYLDGMFLPLHVYSNTDYDTLRSSLIKDKENIISKFGQDIYDYHANILSSYVSMRVDHPIKDKRYRLNPFGEIARETMTIPIDGEREVSVTSAFTSHVRTLKNSDFILVSKDVFTNRILNQRTNPTKGSGSSDEEKKKAKEEAEKEISDSEFECQRLFSEFLTNNLDGDTLKVLNKKINETYNRSIVINTTKIPVGFKHSNMFKTKQFNLMPVQVEAIKFAISRNNYCLALTVGFGKGHLLTSKLVSPKGYVKMGDVKVGDDVIGKNGLPTKILGIFPLGKVQCYKVTFSDGSFSEVSDEHLWNVQTFNERAKRSNRYGQWRTLQTKDIIKDVKNKRGNCKYSIPMTSPVEFDKKETPIHPYLLGLLLGDGTLRDDSICISNKEKDILEKIGNLLPDTLQLRGGYNDGTDWRISNIKKSSRTNEILNSIKELGLSNTKSNSKFIPEIYKINSFDVRLEVLRGLLDTDGYITNPSKTDERNGNSIIYTTVSKQLCDDVVFLVQSFGGTCIINEKSPNYTYKGERKQGQLAYDITIRLSSDIIPVSSKKQLAKYKPKTKY